MGRRDSAKLVRQNLIKNAGWEAAPSQGCGAQPALFSDFSLTVSRLLVLWDIFFKISFGEVLHLVIGRK